MSKLAKTHMGRKPSNFRQGDVRKALQAVRDAGHTPDRVVGSWDQGFVTASGTWTLDGQNHAFPINMSEIQCIKDDRRCYAAAARLSGRYLVADLDFYNVTKWDSSTLEFVTDAVCVAYVYVINRNTEKLTGRRVAKTTDDPTCKSIISSPVLGLSFVNGLDVVTKLRSEAAPTLISLPVATIWTGVILFWIWRVVRRCRP